MITLWVGSCDCKATYKEAIEMAIARAARMGKYLPVIAKVIR